MPKVERHGAVSPWVIAWDEAEKVPVAAEAIIQPAMEAAVAGPASLFARRSFPPDILRCLEERSEFSVSRIADDVSHSTARLREESQRGGIPVITIEKWLVWAQGQDGDGAERLRALQHAAELLTELRGMLDAPVLRDVIEPRIRQALSGSPESMVNSMDHFRAVVDKINRSRRALDAAGCPGEVIDHLLAWALEPGFHDRSRIEAIRAFAEALEHLPFSAGSRDRHWRAFLDSALTPDSGAHAVATRWLADSRPIGCAAV